MLDTGHNWPVAAARRNALKVHGSLQCGAWLILYHTTWCWSGVYIFPWARCYRLEAVKNHSQDPLWKVVVRQFARANQKILADDNPALETKNTKNYSEMKKVADKQKLPRMAKVRNVLEMWQGSQNLRATRKESSTQNKQIRTVGYISNMEEIIKASWSLFPPDGAAAFKLSERSPLPPGLSAKDLPAVQTQIFDVRQIRRINCHPDKTDEYSAPESISDPENGLNWNRGWDNLNDSADDCAAHVESDIEQHNGIENPECPEQRDVTGTPNVPWLIRPTRKSMRQAEKALVTVHGIETKSSKGVKKKSDTMDQCFTSFIM